MTYRAEVQSPPETEGIMLSDHRDYQTFGSSEAVMRDWALEKATATKRPVSIFKTVEVLVVTIRPPEEPAPLPDGLQRLEP